MRVFTTRTHGMLDYAAGALLLVSPWILGFARGGPETWVPVTVGAAVLAYSAGTDYELGPLKRVQMTVHLWMDAVAGLLLGVSPWLFAFDDHVWLPHLVLGASMLIAAAVTDTIPGYERRGAARTGA